ncbi:MAG TPA: SRPBCC family protein [Caulobacteraceae bacterium]|jgi:uncharacterized protein YndB with AHSA1/START domain
MDATLTRLTMTRRFDAAPERLFDAWTDPALVARWLFTSPASTAHTVDLDLRIGGPWRIADTREGVVYTALGEYDVIERPRRLAFTFGMPQFSPEFAVVIVEIATDGAGALMTLTQEPLPADAVAATEAGWSEMFEALAGLLT